jgi:hypothetical protein
MDEPQAHEDEEQRKGRRPTPHAGRGDGVWKGLAQVWALLDEWEEEARGRRRVARRMLWVALALSVAVGLFALLFPAAATAALRALTHQ